MDHGGMGGGAHRCQMSMLFTWDTQDLCLVFRWWHVSSTLTLIISLLAVVGLSMGYEFLRALSRKYEHRVNSALTASTESFGERPTSSSSTETSSLLLPSPGRVVVASGSKYAAASAKRGHLGKAIFYGAQVFYSFFIMLLFMTYNGWVMVAVAVGASLGYLVWGGEEAATKSVACH